MNRPGWWLRRLCITMILVVASLAVLVVQTIREGEREYELSERAFDQGDVREAALHARRAAAAYVPGAPHVDRAYARLIAIAVGAEAAGDERIAKFAWTAIRAAAVETAHIYVPRRAELLRADEALARLSGTTRTELGSELSAENTAANQHQVPDRAGAVRVWRGLATIGLGFTLLGFLWVGIRGVNQQGRIRKRSTSLGVLFVIIGMIFWTIAAHGA